MFVQRESELPEGDREDPRQTANPAPAPMKLETEHNIRHRYMYKHSARNERNLLLCSRIKKVRSGLRMAGHQGRAVDRDYH